MAIRLSTHEMDETGNANFNHHTSTNGIGDGNEIGQQSGRSQKSPHWIPTFKEAPSPKTIRSIVRRIRALILCLLPVEVEQDSIKGQEGILDQNVVLSFSQVAGDFGSIIPFALLMARKSFVNDAKDSEYTLNSLRALACEVLARRVVARAHKLYIEGKIRPSYRHPTEHCLVERFICYEQREGYFDQEEGGGSLTSPKNALELAVDQQLIIFLSSSSVQHVVEDIWKGRIVRVYKPDGTYRFVSSIVGQSPSFLSHFGDTSRLAVPRNYYFLQVFIWIIFISIYTLVTRSYGDGTLDLPEVLLWIFIASYLLEDVQRWIRQKSMDYFTLWNILDLATDVLYLISFGLRIYGWLIPDYEDGRNDSLKEALHLKSFQFLSLLAPLLWFQLLKAFDVVQFFGIVMIVMTRMLGEAGTFAVLLIVNSVGFGQALFSLDLSDPDQGIRHPTRVLLETFAKSIIGVVDFNLTSQNFGYPFGQILFYISAFVSRLLLATILTALFSTAYATVQKDSKTIFSSYFAEKVIGLIKNPDQHVYLPPINLLEVFLISPLEFILPRRAYSKLNNFLQYCFFALPLGLIALYEVRVDYREKKSEALKDRPKDRDRIEASDQRSGGSVENPEVGEAEGNKGLVISRVKFEDLVKRLPDVQANDEDLKHLTGDETPDADETLIPDLTPSSSGNLKTSATATSATSSPDPSKEPSMDEVLTELLKLRSENVSNDTILKGLKGLAK